MFTARTATNRVVIAETGGSASIIIFTRLVSDITSVALNATALVNDAARLLPACPTACREAVVGRRLCVSRLVVFEAADNQVRDELGVFGDGTGVARVGRVEVAGEGDEREGRAPPRAIRKWKARSEMGRVRPQSARWSSRRSIGAFVAQQSPSRATPGSPRRAARAPTGRAGGRTPRAPPGRPLIDEVNHPK